MWFEESATTIKLSGPTATPLGQVKYPGSLPRPPILNNNCRFCKYCTLGVEPTPCIPKNVCKIVSDLIKFYLMNKLLCI